MTKPKGKENLKWLGEIIEKEEIKFGSNNLILSPVGSGKTYFIRHGLKFDKMALMLVSNSFLKDMIASEDNTITTQDRVLKGNDGNKLYVMTYAEFGGRIRVNNDFAEKFTHIFCDEIHSLPQFRGYSGSEELSHAIKYLFDKNEGQQIFYFTATSEQLEILVRDRKGQMRDVETYDFRDRDDIIKYYDFNIKKFRNFTELEMLLRDFHKDFTTAKRKGLVYCKRIVEMENMADMLEGLGYRVLLLWSVNNEDKPLSEEQLLARQELIDTNKIPEGYDFLIINSAMREGWDLNDDSVDIVILNTTNKTDKIQARGRARKDIHYLIERVNEEDEVKIVLSSVWLNNPLTTAQKNELVNELNIIDFKGVQRKWRGIKTDLEKSGYKIKDMTLRINKKRTRVSVISKPE